MFIYENLTVIFVPIFSAIFVCGYIILWIFTFLFIFSIGTFEASPNSPFSSITYNTSIHWLMFFHVVTLLWNVAFFIYYNTFIISCAGSIWYFNGGNGYFSWPVLISAWWGIRYHLGSIGLGSFVLMLLWLVQLILMAITHYVNKLKTNGIESKCIDLFLKCMMCYVSCFTRLIQFLSELGFAQVAITDTNFCSSC